MRNFVTYQDHHETEFATAAGLMGYGDTRVAAMKNLRAVIEAAMMLIEAQPEWNSARLDALNDIVTDLDMELDQCLTTTPSYSPHAC